MSLNRTILCSKLKNGLCKIVVKSQVSLNLPSLNQDCTVLWYKIEEYISKIHSNNFSSFYYWQKQTATLNLQTFFSPFFKYVRKNHEILKAILECDAVSPALFANKESTECPWLMVLLFLENFRTSQISHKLNICLKHYSPNVTHDKIFVYNFCVLWILNNWTYSMYKIFVMWNDGWIKL